MVIRELKPSHHVPGRWLAVLEDGSILRLGESEVLEFGLYTGRELTDGEGEAILAAARRSGLKERAIDRLSRKPMSRRELEKQLLDWKAGAEEAAAICDRMEELGFLNDGDYARRVVRHYARKGYGEKKLRDELYRRGIPRELWEEALEETGDSARAIDDFLAKKLEGKAWGEKDLQKVSAALARRGYSWSDIRDALNRFGAEVEME